LTQARSAVRKLNEESKRIRSLDIDEGVRAERLEALRERVDAEFVRFNRVYNQVEQATR
jgi:NAD(P)H-hydrate repair Nnr-like enzyme with NAD(P)H-hydrate epimerase domain